MNRHRMTAADPLNHSRPMFPADPPGQPGSSGQPGPTGHATQPARPDLLAGFAVATGYLGALVLGPFPPLVLYLSTGERATGIRGRGRAGFIRAHATQALNTSLTFLLYAVSDVVLGAVLTADSVLLGIVTAAAVFAAGWLIMAVLLIRAMVAAGRGEFRRLPDWACARIVP